MCLLRVSARPKKDPQRCEPWLQSCESHENIFTLLLAQGPEHCVVDLAKNVGVRSDLLNPFNGQNSDMQLCLYGVPLEIDNTPKILHHVFGLSC